MLESKTYSKGLETGPSGVSSTGVVKIDVPDFLYLMAYANAADPLICVISGFGFLKEFAKECGSVVNVADCIGL